MSTLTKKNQHNPQSFILILGKESYCNRTFLGFCLLSLEKANIKEWNMDIEYIEIETIIFIYFIEIYNNQNGF